MVREIARRAATMFLVLTTLAACTSSGEEPAGVTTSVSPTSSRPPEATVPSTTTSPTGTAAPGTTTSTVATTRPPALSEAEYIGAVNEINADLIMAQYGIAGPESLQVIVDALLDALRRLRALSPPPPLDVAHEGYTQGYADLADVTQTFLEALERGTGDPQQALRTYLDGAEAVTADLAVVDEILFASAGPVLREIGGPVADFLAARLETVGDVGDRMGDVFDILASLAEDPAEAFAALANAAVLIAADLEALDALRPPGEIAFLVERERAGLVRFLDVLERLGEEMERRDTPSTLLAVEMQAAAGGAPLFNAGWAYLTADVLRGNRRPLSGSALMIGGEPMGDTDRRSIEAALAPLIEATGMRIVYREMEDPAGFGSGAFTGRPAPDIALLADPTEVAAAARSTLEPLSAEVEQAVEDAWPAGWLDLTRFDGVAYAVPTSSTIESVIWYRPDRFAEGGYEVPTTWGDLESLTARIVEDGEAPWCIDVHSPNFPTGRAFMDWTDEALLRSESGEVFDAWVRHEFPFDDPRVAAAWTEVLELWTVAADAPGPGWTDETTTADAIADLRLGNCLMLRTGSSALDVFPAATVFGEDGIDVFPVPGAAAGERPATVQGTFAAALRPGTGIDALLIYLSSGEFASERQRTTTAAIGRPNSYLSAVRDQPLAGQSDIEAALTGMLQTTTEVRHDSTPLLPIGVGLAILRGEQAVISGDQDLATALASVEDAWKNHEASFFDPVAGLEACISGDELQCDLLLLLSPSSSVEAAVGFECAGRREDNTASCAGFTGDPPPQGPGDDLLLDALWALCEPGNIDACLSLYDLSPSGSEYESLADDRRFGLTG